MSNYMRFIVTDGELRLEEIAQALKALDGDYDLRLHGDQRHHSGDLYHGDRLGGEIEVNRPGDDLFEDEIGELMALLEDVDDEARDGVMATLQSATGMVAFRVLEQDGRSLDLLWQWLHEHREGLLQADGEGYYDRDGLVLTLE